MVQKEKDVKETCKVRLVQVQTLLFCAAAYSEPSRQPKENRWFLLKCKISSIY